MLEFYLANHVCSLTQAWHTRMVCPRSGCFTSLKNTYAVLSRAKAVKQALHYCYALVSIASPQEQLEMVWS